MKQKRLFVLNNKGGVLKTSMTLNLAGVFARRGLKVLIIDTDQQGNIVESFGLKKQDVKTDLLDVLLDNRNFPKALVETPVIDKKNSGKIDILPAGFKMNEFDKNVFSGRIKPNAFNELLDNYAKNYDIIIYDTSPSIGILQSFIMLSTPYILIPVIPESFAVSGARLTDEIVSKINEEIAKSQPGKYKIIPKILGVIFVKVEKNTSEHKYIMELVKKENDQVGGLDVFNTFISKSIKYSSDTRKFNKPSTLKSNVYPVSQYYDLADEIIERINKKK